MKMYYFILLFGLVRCSAFAEEITTPNGSDLKFRENVGQISDQHGNARNDIDFKLSVPGMSIFIGNGAMHYQWNKTNVQEKPGASKEARVESYRLDVTVLGANPNAEVIAEQETEDKEIFHLHQLKGATAGAYKKIIYKSIYPSIDWVLYIKDEQLKYDFVVHEGGDVKNIRLKYDGASSMAISKGSLVVQTPMGSITEAKPVAFEAASRRKIKAAYVLESNILTFKTGSFRGKMIIDPALLWATYFGGGEYEYLHKMSCDQFGNVYVVGETFSMSNIATAGAHQVNYSNLTEGYIAKFGSGGSLLWATYYGGWGEDVITDVHVGPNNFIYISGNTESNSGIATPGTYQPVFSGNASGDAFAACLTAAGSLVWGTYYGGIGFTNASKGFMGITCDLAGNVYATGVFANTASTNSSALTTPGSYQPLNAGQADALLVKLNANGQRIWATYFGGENTDGGAGLTTDAGGMVYLTGHTRSIGNIATAGAWQPTCASCIVQLQFDGYLAKFDSSGNRLWATYYGGAGYDNLYRIKSDANSNLYVVGSTKSFSNIASPGAHQPIHGNPLNPYEYDGLVAKFDSSGQQIWATYYGGEERDEVFDIALKEPYAVFITGMTWSVNGIATDTSYGGVPTTLGVFSMFMAKLDTGGQRLYSTYYGGSDNDWANGIAYSSATNQIYFGGHSKSPGLATVGSYQQTNQGGTPPFEYDGLLVCFLDSTGSIAQPTIPSPLCAGVNVSVTNNASGFFFPNNIFNAELSDASGSFAAPVVIGSVVSSVAGNIPCVIPINTPSGNGYRVRVVSTHPIIRSQASSVIQINPAVPGASVAVSASPGTTISPGASVTFTATVTNGGVNPTYQWKKNSINIPGATSNSYTTNVIANNDAFSVEVQSSTLCAPASQSFSMVMHVVNSVNDLTSSETFAVAPNPFEEIFRIENKRERNLFITVTDITGKKITAFESGKRTVEINMSGFPSGVYFYKITTDDGVQSGKIIKK